MVSENKKQFFILILVIAALCAAFPLPPLSLQSLPIDKAPDDTYSLNVVKSHESIVRED